jgi:hypothetical protein
VKTFNHLNNLSLNQKSDESMDFHLSAHNDTITTHHSPDKLYFDGIKYNYSEHSLESKDGICWMRYDEEIADKMETIRLDQPLDLSVRHKR